MRIALIAPLLLAFVGCSDPPMQLRVEPSAYFSYGYYIGSKANVKIFVEDLTFVGEQKGTVAVEVGILNERQQPVRFFYDDNYLVIGQRRLGAMESQGVIVKPGELMHVTLQFRTDMNGLDRASLELNGFEVELGTRVHFAIPIYAVDVDKPEPATRPGGGMKRH